MTRHPLLIALDEMNRHLSAIEKTAGLAASKSDWAPWLLLGVIAAAVLWLAYLNRRLLRQSQAAQGKTNEAVQIAQDTLKQQMKQSQTDLWRTLVREWNHDLVLDRKFFATYWKDPRMLKVRYAKVLNFFETLGYLIHLNVVDGELCKQTFWQPFSAYFEASRDLLQEDRKLNSALYRYVFGLHGSWGADPLISRDQGLAGFMSEESVLAK